MDRVEGPRKPVPSVIRRLRPSINPQSQTQSILQNQSQPTFQHLTISDDQTVGSNVDARKLIALNNSDVPASPTGYYSSTDESDDDEPVLSVRRDKKVERSTQRLPPISLSIGGKGGPRMNFGGVTGSSHIISEPSAGLNKVIDGTMGRIDHASTRDEKVPDDNLSLEELKIYIRTLQDKARQLESFEDSKKFQQYRILYRIRSLETTVIYLDHPEWIEAGRTIKSRKVLQNFDLYLERNKGISFIVFHDFDDRQNADNCDNLDEPNHLGESLYIVADELDNAVKRLFSHLSGYSTLLTRCKANKELEAPYLFLYHNRENWEELMLIFSQSERQQLTYMTNYIFKSFGREYSKADALFNQGEVSRHFMNFLFQPGDLLVHSTDSKDHQGCIAISWPRSSSVREDFEKDSEYGKNAEEKITSRYDDEYYNLERNHLQDNAKHYSTKFSPNFDKKPTQNLVPGSKQANRSFERPYSCSIKTWSWAFRGNFVQNPETFKLQLPPAKSSGHRDGIFKITDLEIYPIKYASALVLETLKRRGQMFWKCRKRRLVSYQENDGKIDQAVSYAKFPSCFLPPFYT